MGLLDKKSKLFKASDPPKIRVEKVPIERKPKPPSSSSSSSSKRPSYPSSRPGSNRASPLPSSPSSSPSSASARLDRKRKTLSSRPARRSPAAVTVSNRVEFGRDSDSEDDGDWASRLDAKRQKRGRLSDGTYVDPNRSLRHKDAFKEGTPAAKLIHAADVASLRHKCVPVLGAKEDEVAVELQYPSLQPRERYELVWGKDLIDAVSSIISVVRHVADSYLTDVEAQPFTDHTKGIARQLEKASNPKVNDLVAFKTALEEYNEKMLALVKDGTVAKNLDKRHELPRSFVQFLLNQVYDRTVAPRVELLSKYENGSDNVYGELLHPFISKILIEQLQMTSDQVFVDLGSGVGNVVIQAALEIGCESWGCEMMENACNLADAQEKEFTARCMLWGLAPGKVRLERGDFRKNEAIQEALKRADVVLVNNQAFTSQLNDDLVRMFLDLKTGCKIVSLKTFVHDHKSASNDVGRTILDVEQLTYPEDYVSWTNAGGTYCISTRK